MLTAILFICINSYAQRITALHGSSYAGSIANEYNPAAVMNNPDRWDLFMIGLQSRMVTNKLNFVNSGLFRPHRSAIHIKEGSFKRSIHAANTLNLLHFRFKANAENTFSIGMNMRSYFHSHSGPAYFSDQTKNVRDFIRTNELEDTYYGNLQNNNWLELILGYSRTLHEDAGGRLNAGINLKIMRSIAGGYGTAERINIGEIGDTTYALTEVDGKYAHSTTFDDLFYNDQVNFGRAFRNARTTLGLNLGVEYVSFGDVGAEDGHDWKLGISLMDLGKHTYTYSKYSFESFGVKTPLEARRFDRFIKNVGGFENLQDTLRQWVNSYDTLKGNFSINDPTRVIVNFDKHIRTNFYVNAEIQMNLRNTADMKDHNTKELSFVTITPRWETRMFGAYVPISYTNGNIWMGLAGKIGPLIMGVDNLGWVVGKKSMPNGGFYIALQFRGGESPAKDKPIPCFKF